MPGQFLSEAERERVNKFPEKISKDDTIAYFTLTDEDLRQIPQKSADYNRLGFALKLCALRFMGFCPDYLSSAPSSVVAYIAPQLRVEPRSLEFYGQKEHTNTDHMRKVQEYLGFHKATQKDLEELSEWLLGRALDPSSTVSKIMYLPCQDLRDPLALVALH